MKLTLRNAFEYVLKGPKMKQLKTYFTMLEGYSPVFSTYDGGVYEMELTRTCIHSFATHVSKLQPHVEGPDLRGLQAILDHKPNPFMTSVQFLYKCATLYEAKNTLLILPILDKADRVVGYYPANYSLLEVMEVEGSPEPWIRVTFNGGQTVAYELSRCGLCSKYLYNSDLVGEDNTALGPTMQLLHDHLRRSCMRRAAKELLLSQRSRMHLTSRMPEHFVCLDVRRVFHNDRATASQQLHKQQQKVLIACSHQNLTGRTADPPRAVEVGGDCLPQPLISRCLTCSQKIRRLVHDFPVSLFPNVVREMRTVHCKWRKVNPDIGLRALTPGPGLMRLPHDRCPVEQIAQITHKKAAPRPRLNISLGYQLFIGETCRKAAHIQIFRQ